MNPKRKPRKTDKYLPDKRKCLYILVYIKILCYHMHKAKQFFFAGIISVQERRTAYEPKKIIKRIKLAG